LRAKEDAQVVSEKKPRMDEALRLSTHPDEVEIEGPDGISGALTPRAALQSAHRLEAAAQDASRKGGRRTGWSLRSSSDRKSGTS